MRQSYQKNFCTSIFHEYIFNQSDNSKEGIDTMGETNSIMPTSANLKKAICWLSDMVQDQPDLKRKEVIQQAEIRFDLTPRECEFLNANFNKVAPNNNCK